MDFNAMSLDDLFSALRVAAIAEYEAEDGDPQHAAAQLEGDLVRAIARRGGTESYYRRMLVDEHPRVRFRGAVGIEKTAPSDALRVIRELSKMKLEGGLTVSAMLEVMALEKLGIT